jgi:phosphatidylglycerophosphate synthase
MAAPRYLDAGSDDMSEESYRGERRPIAARSWKLSGWIAAQLAAAGASPNGISVAGAVFGVLGGLAFFATSRWPAGAWLLWLVGTVLVQLRLQCNLYDGMVAIATGRASPVGELYNDVPDRISDSAFFVGAGFALSGDVSLGYAAALAAMFTAYVRAVGKAGGATQVFCGPMAKQHRMALLTLVSVYLAFAPPAWQWIEIGSSRMGVMAIALAIIAVGSVGTAIRRLLIIATQLRELPR